MNECTYNIEWHYPQYHTANFPRGTDGAGTGHDETVMPVCTDPRQWRGVVRTLMAILNLKKKRVNNF